MKYVRQALVIALVTLAGELLRFFVPLPIPASIYGLLLLFLLLKTGLVKLRQVQDVGQLLLDLMPVLLVPACVSLVTALDALRQMLLPVLLMGTAATVAVMVVTGLVAQRTVRDGEEADPYA